jgi:hypothetical protein
MRFPSRLIFGIVTVMAFAGGASAAPIVWQLSGVTLSDGGTASGMFTFNPDAGTPCSTGTTPCGTYSNVDIVTTAGASRTGATYMFVCGQDVATCTGLSPASTEALFLTSNAANQTGDPGLALLFTGVGGVPPAGLTDLGGTIDISGSSDSVGTGLEASCEDAACAHPVSPSRFTVAGSVVSAAAVPEPASCVLLLTGLGAMALRRRHAAARR